MGSSNLIPLPRDHDWVGLRHALSMVNYMLGRDATPTFSGLFTTDLTVTNLTLTGLSGILKATAGVVTGSAVHADLGSIGANDHHNQAHVLDGADHTVSGLTAGHVLTALTATTFGFSDNGLGAYQPAFDIGTGLELTTGEVLAVEQAATDVSLYLGDYGNHEWRPGQSFQLTTAGAATKVSVYFNTANGSPTGDVTLRLETDNAGFPSGTLVHASATTTLANATAKVDGWHDFTFSENIDLGALTTYWVVLDCANQSSGVRFRVRSQTADPYAGGKWVDKYDGTWQDLVGGTYDMAFRVYTYSNNLHTLDSEIIHDSLSGGGGVRHIDHSAVSILAGTGLTGGGTLEANRTLALSHLGIQSLTSPGADRILFWDQSAVATGWLNASTGLNITGTALTCTITQYTDALALAAVNPMTTLGDLVLGGASGVPSRLGIGANTYVLTSNGTTAAWAASAAGFANPMTTAGDLILGGAAGAAGRLAIGTNAYVLTSNGTTATWAEATGGGGGSGLEAFGVFQTLLETYRIAGKGITKLVDGIVINGLSAGWSDSSLSSNFDNNTTYGFQFPTGGNILFVYNEWGDYQATAVGDSGNTEFMQAQSFTLAGDSAIAGVSLGIEAVVGGITDSITARIETDNAGSPSGTVAGATVDQEQAVQDGSVSIGDVSNVEYRMAQSFQTSGAISCPKVSVYFGARAGSPTGNFTVRLETNNAGFPSGTLVHADATKALASITDSTWNEFTFPSSISLAASTTYWLVTSCDNQATNVRWTSRIQVTGAYANGLLVKSTDGGASWSTYDAGVYDMTFRIYAGGGLSKAQAGVAGVWNNFTFAAGATLAAGTYWLVASVPAQSTNKHYRWNLSRSNPYSGGARKQSTNGGSTWTQPSANDDFQFKVWAADTVAVNITIVSNGVPLSAVPTQCNLLVLYSETNDSLTLNTDVNLYASRDDGATFTQLTATLSAGDPRWKVAYGTLDVSGQPSGQIGRFKITTANNKNVFIHGYAAQWS